MNKIWSVVAALLLLPAIANAQRLTATKMVKLFECDEYSCFHDQLDVLGYQAKYTDEDETHKVYDYSGSKIIKNSANPKIALRHKVKYTIGTKANELIMEHTVPAEVQYEQLLREFKVMGFEYRKASRLLINEHNTTQEYENPEFSNVLLTVAIVEMKTGKETYKEYRFLLRRPLNNKEGE